MVLLVQTTQSSPQLSEVVIRNRISALIAEDGQAAEGVAGLFFKRDKRSAS